MHDRRVTSADGTARRGFFDFSSATALPVARKGCSFLEHPTIAVMHSKGEPAFYPL
jgi:hypothetical protein